MKKLFIPYELALLAKEKGFDEPCLMFYIAKKQELNYDDIEDWINCTNKDTFSESKNCTAPLYQQIIDWFRETHQIFIYINPFDQVLNHRNCVLFKWAIKDKSIASQFSTYEQARDNVIEEAFKLI